MAASPNSDRGPDLTSRTFQRIAAVLLLAALPMAHGQPDDAAVPAFEELDTMQARVQGCTTCHGQRGQGTSNQYFPRIAGKPAGYLFNQLRAFRDGTRRYAPMNYLLAYLTDDYLREIADHFSRIRPPFQPPRPPAVAADVLQRGRTLVHSGDAGKQVPPCVACHGPNLTGMEPGIPGLVGLRPNYIAAQLTRWRAGERRAAAPDCMHRIAIRLSEADIQGVAAWLGSLPAPQSAEPERRNALRMPMACGSQP